MLEKIHSLPLADWNENLKKKELKWKPTVSPDFLPHCLPLLASTPLVRNPNGKISANATISALATDALLDTPNEPVKASTIRALIGFLFLAPRSQLQKLAMTKNPVLGSLTPMWMHAHKLYNNVQYEEWAKDDPAIHYALGNYLKPITQYGTTKTPKLMGFTSSELNHLRALGLTPVKGGEAAALTSNKMNCTMVEKNYYPKVVMQMLLQTWLANSALRVPGTMILDPLNWDKVPGSLDAGVEKLEVQPLIKPKEDDYLDLI